MALSVASDTRPTPTTMTLWWMAALPVAFVLHDGEEFAIVARAGGLWHMGLHLANVPQTLAAMTFELLGLSLVTVAAVHPRRTGLTLRVYTALLATFTAHGLIHLGAAVVTHAYAMGVATALPLCVGYGALTLRRLAREDLVPRQDLMIAAAWGTVAAAPLIALSIAVGHLLV